MRLRSRRNGLQCLAIASSVYPFNGSAILWAGNKKFSRTDALAGIEYYGFTDTIISFELANRHLNDLIPSLKDYPIVPLKTIFKVLCT